MAKEIKYKLEVLGGYLATFWGELADNERNTEKSRSQETIS